MITALIALAVAGFQYEARRDMITDQITHIATLDLGGRRSLMIVCGAGTDGELIVNYKPGKSLDDRKGGILLPFTNRFRFGTNQPIDLEVTYRKDTVIIDGRDAWTFLTEAKLSSTVTIEYQDYSDSVFQHRFALDGLPVAAAAIESRCSRN